MNIQSWVLSLLHPWVHFVIASLHIVFTNFLVYFSRSRTLAILTCREVHPEIQEAIMTILWSGPRLEADVPELPKICKALEARFGKVRRFITCSCTAMLHVYIVMIWWMHHLEFP